LLDGSDLKGVYFDLVIRLIDLVRCAVAEHNGDGLLAVSTGGGEPFHGMRHPPGVTSEVGLIDRYPYRMIVDRLHCPALRMW
jgi:hypothetical protein